MRSRKFLIGANWKMNPAPTGFDGPDSPYRTKGNVDVVVFPALTDMHACMHAQLIVGAQGARPESPGAFTGDVNMAMLSKAGCRYVLCGHSERRAKHGESDEFVMEQVIAALEAKLHPVICVGESDEERKKGKQEAIVKKQLKGVPQGVTIAYEPVWAIGTGKTPTPEDAEAMHAFIRSLLAEGEQATTRIIYGGSMNLKTAEGLLSQKNIDGGLIGGASLKIDEFRQIVAIAEALSS